MDRIEITVGQKTWTTDNYQTTSNCRLRRTREALAKMLAKIDDEIERRMEDKNG